MENKYRYITYDDRRQIAADYAGGMRPADMARKLGVHTATIYHELQRGFTGERDEYGYPVYSAELAQRTVMENIKRRGRRQGGASSA